jgi:DNA-binding transcriptional regulator GbsR (MarR family)
MEVGVVDVPCDQCKEDFPIVLKEKKHGKGIIETYFICPHCSHRYSSAFTNTRARKCQRQIRKLWDEIRGCKNVQLAELKKEKIDKLTKENKQIISELKEQFASS